MSTKQPKKAKVVITIKDQDGLGMLDISTSFVRSLPTKGQPTPAQNFALRLLQKIADMAKETDE